MLGLDTNALVRFLFQDDAEQFERARRLIKRKVSRGEPVLVSLLVLLETEWVLRRRYTLPDIIGVLSLLFEAADLKFEDEAAVEEAIFAWRDSAVQFADCLISARHRQLGCRATATFDSKAAKLRGFIAA